MHHLNLAFQDQPVAFTATKFQVASYPTFASRLLRLGLETVLS
jgi:hypothetical protein